MKPFSFCNNNEQVYELVCINVQFQINISFAFHLHFKFWKKNGLYPFYIIPSTKPWTNKNSSKDLEQYTDIFSDK